MLGLERERRRVDRARVEKAGRRLENGNILYRKYPPNKGLVTCKTVCTGS